MLSKLEQLRKNRESGFTIIEVMIVLAIAGLILLIVLLAVPALQRNSRNTQIKNDAANIVGAISTFSTDNDGSIPARIEKADDSEEVKLSKGGTDYATATAKSTIKIQAGTVVKPLAADKPTSIEPGELYPVSGKACDTADGVTVKRSISVWYAIETSSGKTDKCVSS